MKQINDETVENVIDLLKTCTPPMASMDLLDTALLANRINRAIAELENADPVPDLELLKDPTAVLTMILRGTIAKPDGFERVGAAHTADDSDPNATCVCPTPVVNYWNKWYCRTCGHPLPDDTTTEHIESDPVTSQPRAVEGEVVDYGGHPDNGKCDACADHRTTGYPCTECSDLWGPAADNAAPHWRPRETNP